MQASTPKPSNSSSTGSVGTIHLDIQYPDLEEMRTALADVAGIRDTPSIFAKLIFVDLNGDKADDLVLYDGVLSYAFLWLGSSYTGPFPLNERYGFNSVAWSKLSLQDVTFDGLPDIVLDVAEFYPWGTGLFGGSWYRSYTHCQEVECSVVLRVSLDNLSIDDNFGGNCVGRGSVSLLPSESKIRYYSEGFSIYGCGFWDGADFDIPKLRIEESTVTTYQWDGSTFIESNVETARLAATIESRSQLVAVSDRGVIAEVVAKSNALTVERINDYCQLYISGEPVGGHFGCKRKFTRVDWVDLTGNGTQEVVAIAYSGASAFDLEGDIGSQKCAHQHLVAYVLRNGKPEQLADVVGCTVRADLVGVYLEDVDGNGTLEIIAAVDPLQAYWVFESNSSNNACDNRHTIELSPTEFQSCNFFEFEPLFTIYSWNGQSYSPMR